MSALNFTKLADAPILEEVPDGAKVYAEVDGKVYRVAGDNLGGGGGSKAAVIHMDISSTTSVQSLFNGAATVDAGDGARSTATFPATCENMTFEEALAAARSNKLNTVLTVEEGGMLVSFNQTMYAMQPSGSEGNYDIVIVYDATAMYGSGTVVALLARWTSDGTIEVGELSLGDSE